MIRSPGVVRCGEYLYNFWRDASNPRGLWRRTTVEEYRKDSPDWDIIIDVDALAADEEENWVWGGAGIIEPGYTRAFVDLSRGGEDASVVREFDMTTRQFVTDGFNLPEAKTDISWEDENTVLVGTDFGEGSSTDSGYPRVIKRWRRGTRLDEAETVFCGSASDVAASTLCNLFPGFERTFIYRVVDFYNKETFELRDGELIRLDIPTDCSFGAHREWAMLALVSDWVRGGTTYRAGSVLVTDYEQLVAGTAELQVVFEPGGDDFFAAGTLTGDRFLSIKLRNVATVVEVLTPGIWNPEPLPGVPANTTTTIASIDVFGDESSSPPAASTPRLGCCTDRRRDPCVRSSPRRRFSTPMTWLSPSTSPLPPTAHRSRTFLLLTVIRLNPAQPCWRVTAPFGWRSCRDISASPADCGWPWR